MTDLWIVLAALLFVYSIYLIWASAKISLRQDENFYRVESFEEKLEDRPSEYD